MGALWKVYILYRSLIEALYTLNSSPLVSLNIAEAGQYLVNGPLSGCT